LPGVSLTTEGRANPSPLKIYRIENHFQYQRRKEMTKLMLLASVIAGMALAACGGGQAPAPSAAGKLKVVATFSILGDWVQAVGGDKIELRVLVGPDADAHDFEPTPNDSKALSEAKLIFENGLGFEHWLDKLYQSSGSKASRVAATEGLTPLKIELGKEAGEIDPHAWHDVKNAISAVKVIREALMKADPKNAETYQTNAEAYLKELELLDQFILDQVKTLPTAQRKLVTNHDTFGYFAKRYSFALIGSALSSVSTEAGDPSAADLAKVVREIKDAKVPVVFAENVKNVKVMQQIAKEANVQLGATLFTDALSKEKNEGSTYLKMMRYNVTTIVNSLR
jgi:zinc/manganese transport system substrate-binding protein